jgi:hypothetical protein
MGCNARGRLSRRQGVGLVVTISEGEVMDIWVMVASFLVGVLLGVWL